MAVAERQQEPPLAALENAATTLGQAQEEIAWTRRPRRQVLIFGLALLLLATLLSAWLGLRQVEQRLEAQILPSSRAIGMSLAQQFEVALSAGIPFEALAGVEAFLATAASFDDRIGFAALFDAAGTLRHAAGPRAHELPQNLDRSLTGRESLRLLDQLGTPTAIHAQEQLQGYVLVGLEAGLPAEALRIFLLALLLIFLSVGVLLWESLRGVLYQALERPALALARLARALEEGDLSRTTWLTASGRLGQAVEALRERLVSVNGRFHAFLLGAFATRAGHFDPAVLREVTLVVRRCLTNYRLPPVAGAWPVPLEQRGLYRLAAFSLLLGEALLIPAWQLLPLFGIPRALPSLLYVFLPFLFAVPLGSESARRLLVGFADGLIFTAGALIAAAATLALPLVANLEGLIALRLLSGFGIGIALSPLGARSPLPAALATAFLATVAPGLLALFIFGIEVIAPLAAFLMAAAGLLAGQMLPSDEEEQKGKASTPSNSFPWANPLPAAVLAATPAALSLTGELPGNIAGMDVSLVLYGSLGLLFALLASDWLAKRWGVARGMALVAGAAGLLFTLLAFLPREEAPAFVLPAALLLSAVVFLGPRPHPSYDRGPATSALAAAFALLGSLFLATSLGPSLALLLPAVLLFAYAASWRLA